MYSYGAPAQRAVHTLSRVLCYAAWCNAMSYYLGALGARNAHSVRALLINYYSELRR